MLGYPLPAAETARQWLDKFHDEGLMKERPLQGSFTPGESAALAGLKEPNRLSGLGFWRYGAAPVPSQNAAPAADVGDDQSRSEYPPDRGAGTQRC